MELYYSAVFAIVFADWHAEACVLKNEEKSESQTRHTETIRKGSRYKVKQVTIG